MPFTWDQIVKCARCRVTLYHPDSELMPDEDICYIDVGNEYICEHCWTESEKQAIAAHAHFLVHGDKS